MNSMPSAIPERCTRFMRAFITIVAIFAASCSENSSQTIDKDTFSQKADRLHSTASTPGLDRDNSWAAFNAKYSVNSMWTELYAGKLAKPDFNSVNYGTDQKFHEFMRERLEGQFINFGGKYTIVEKSCGAMCSAIYLVDRKTGKILSFPQTDGHWGYKDYPNSTLLLANSSLVNDSMTKYLDQWGIAPEFYQ
jgi:hypothetical protein